MPIETRYYLCVVSDLGPNREPQFDTVNPTYQGWVQVSRELYELARKSAFLTTVKHAVLPHDGTPTSQQRGFFQADYVAGIIYDAPVLRDQTSHTQVDTAAAASPDG